MVEALEKQNEEEKKTAEKMEKAEEVDHTDSSDCFCDYTRFILITASADAEIYG